VHPNDAHLALAQWQEQHEVVVVTQNVDDLHERAGSRQIIHLHGQLTQARSTLDERWVQEIGYAPIRLGDKCRRGGQLRPNIVWFGEAVENMGRAGQAVAAADVVLVVGTSLQVYPAAGLTDYAKKDARRILVDPEPGRVPEGFEVVLASAEIGVPALTDYWPTLRR
jgi:NAD-dependent deacetylase